MRTELGPRKPSSSGVFKQLYSQVKTFPPYTLIVPVTIQQWKKYSIFFQNNRQKKHQELLLFGFSMHLLSQNNVACLGHEIIDSSRVGSQGKPSVSTKIHKTSKKSLSTQKFVAVSFNFGPLQGSCSEKANEEAWMFVLIQQNKHTLNAKAVLQSCCPQVYSWTTQKMQKSLGISAKHTRKPSKFDLGSGVERFPCLFFKQKRLTPLFLAIHQHGTLVVTDNKMGAIEKSNTPDTLIIAVCFNFI